MALSTGWATDTGQRREENQDAVLLRQLDATGALLAAVADGMGGLAGGSIASTTAIAALEAAASPDIGTEGLVAAYRDAHRRIYEDASRAREVRGTTLLAVIVRGGSLYVANVGDCRAYLVNRDAVLQLTTDHSVATEQLAAQRPDARPRAGRSTSPGRRLRPVAPASRRRHRPLLGRPAHPR